MCMAELCVICMTPYPRTSPHFKIVTIRDLTSAGVPKGGAYTPSDLDFAIIIILCETHKKVLTGCDDLSQVKSKISLDDRAFGEYTVYQMIDTRLWALDQMMNPRQLILTGVFLWVH